MDVDHGTSAVAGAIAGVIREHHRAGVQAIGAGAVNQALKAVDLAIVYFKLDKIDIHCVMEAPEETIDEDTRTAIRLIVEAQSSLDLSFELTLRVPILSNTWKITKNDYLSIELSYPPSGGDINSPDAGCSRGVCIVR